MLDPPRRPSIWFTIFCLVFGVGLGYGAAAVVMSFWSVFAGEEGHRGLFVLIWMIASLVFFAAPMHLVARLYAAKRTRDIMRERIGDLDYDPPSLPMLGTRPHDPSDHLRIKGPDIGAGRFRSFLARGRTAEQRMADHLATLELEAEMREASKRAKAGGVDPGQQRPAP